jgi:hypothetical protein
MAEEPPLNKRYGALKLCCQPTHDMASARAPTQSNDDTQSLPRAHLREDIRGHGAINHYLRNRPAPRPRWRCDSYQDEANV